MPKKKLELPATANYYTISEAAIVLDVAFSTVWRWVKNGKITSIEVANQRLIKKSLVDKLNAPTKIPIGYISVSEAAKRTKRDEKFIHRLIGEKVVKSILVKEKMQLKRYIDTQSLAQQYQAIPKLYQRIMYGSNR